MKTRLSRSCVLDMVTHIDRALPEHARTLFSSVCYLAYEFIYEKMPLPESEGLATEIDEWLVKEAYDQLWQLLPPIEQLLLELFWDAVGLSREAEIKDVFPEGLLEVGDNVPRYAVQFHFPGPSAFRLSASESDTEVVDP